MTDHSSYLGMQVKDFSNAMLLPCFLVFMGREQNTAKARKKVMRMINLLLLLGAKGPSGGQCEMILTRESQRFCAGKAHNLIGRLEMPVKC